MPKSFTPPLLSRESSPDVLNWEIQRWLIGRRELIGKWVLSSNCSIPAADGVLDTHYDLFPFHELSLTHSDNYLITTFFFFNKRKRIKFRNLSLQTLNQNIFNQLHWSFCLYLHMLGFSSKSIFPKSKVTISRLWWPPVGDRKFLNFSQRPIHKSKRPGLTAFCLKKKKKSEKKIFLEACVWNGYFKRSKGMFLGYVEV